MRELWDVAREEYFSFEGLQMLESLDPRVSECTSAQVGEAVRNALDRFYARMANPGASRQGAQELSMFRALFASAQTSFADYWTAVGEGGSRMPVLVAFTRALVAAQPTEAAVERHFKVLKAVLCGRRARLDTQRAVDAVTVRVSLGAKAGAIARVPGTTTRRAERLRREWAALVATTEALQETLANAQDFFDTGRLMSSVRTAADEVVRLLTTVAQSSDGDIVEKLLKDAAIVVGSRSCVADPAEDVRRRGDGEAHGSVRQVVKLEGGGASPRHRMQTPRTGHG